jgi:hypothetical protein
MMARTQTPSAPEGGASTSPALTTTPADPRLALGDDPNRRPSGG